MRTKQEIMQEIGKLNGCEFPSYSSANEYLFLEVLIDIRDQLAGINQAPKLQEHIDILNEAVIKHKTPTKEYVIEHPEEFKVV